MGKIAEMGIEVKEGPKRKWNMRCSRKMKEEPNTVEVASPWVAILPCSFPLAEGSFIRLSGKQLKSKCLN